MKKKKPPFTIGEQYELHEFELEDVETLLIGKYEYDVYRCRKKLFEEIKIEGLIDVILYYNVDILGRVDYFVKENFFRDFMNFISPSEKEDVITIKYSIDHILVIVTNSKYLQYHFRWFINR